MAVGTFQLIPASIYNSSLVGVTGWEAFFSVGGAAEVWNDANAITAINICETIAPVKFLRQSALTGYIRFNPSTNFLLDGVLTDRLLYGLGFTLTDFTWQLVARSGAGFSLGTGTIQFVQGALDGEKSIIIPSDFAFNQCLTADNYHATHVFTEQLQLNTLSLLHDPFGFLIPSSTSGGEWNSFKITGNYFRWSSTLTKSPSIGGPGTVVTITDGAPGVLKQITDILIYSDITDEEPFQFSINSHYVQSWTPIQLIFQIPIDLGIPSHSTLYIAFVIDGTTFDGAVSMGTLSPILTDGSGIYTLNKNKRSDTYYNRSVSPVTEIDVKIPDPFIKTGFFNGD